MKRVAAAVAGLAGLVIVLVVAGCSAGQNTQTDGMAPAVNGALGQVGPIAIRDAQLAAPTRGVVHPSGSSVDLIVTIVNSGEANDELTEVTSTVADEVEIRGDRTLPARRFLQVGPGGPAVSVPPSTTTTTLPSASSGTARPTTSPAAPAPVQLGKATIVLKGLNTALDAGKTYPVTFVFRKAGSVTVQVPIANPGGARPEPTGESHG